MQPETQPTNNDTAIQLPKTKKKWQKPEVYILDSNDVSNKHLSYHHESQYSRSFVASAGGAHRWIRPGSVDAGIHPHALSSLVS